MLLRLSSPSLPDCEGGTGGFASGSVSPVELAIGPNIEDDVPAKAGSELPLGVLRPLVVLPPLPLCDNFGIWNLLWSPLMKPSMLAAIVGEAYWRMVIISVW